MVQIWNNSQNWSNTHNSANSNNNNQENSPREELKNILEWYILNWRIVRSDINKILWEANDLKENPTISDLANYLFQKSGEKEIELFNNLPFKIRKGIYIKAINEDINCISSIEDELFWSDSIIFDLFTTKVLKWNIPYDEFISLIEEKKDCTFIHKLEEIFNRKNRTDIDFSNLRINNPSLYSMLENQSIIGKWKLSQLYTKRAAENYFHNHQTDDIEEASFEDIRDYVFSHILHWSWWHMYNEFWEFLAANIYISYQRLFQRLKLKEKIRTQEANQNNENQNEITNSDKEKEKKIKDTSVSSDWYTWLEESKISVSYWAYSYEYEWIKIDIDEEVANKLNDEEKLDYFKFMKTLVDAGIYDFYKFYEEELITISGNYGIKINLEHWNSLKEDKSILFLNLILSFINETWKCTSEDWNSIIEKPKIQTLNTLVSKFQTIKEKWKINNFKEDSSSKYSLIEQYLRYAGFLNEEVPLLKISMLSSQSTILENNLIVAKRLHNSNEE